MTELLVVGGFWFFVLIAIEILFLVIVIGSENHALAFLSLILVGTLLYFFGDIDFVNLVTLNYWKLIIGAFGYLVIGIVWSTIRFYLYYSKAVDNLVLGKSTFFNNKGYDLDNLTEWAKSEWSDYVDKNAPQPYNYKSKIVGWMAWWPFSIVSYFCFDFLTELAEKLYNLIVHFYDNIAKRIRDRAKL